MNVQCNKKKVPPLFTRPSSIEIITAMPTGYKIIIPNIEPLVDEKCEFTNIIGVYTKSGNLPNVTTSFIRKYKKFFKFIWFSSSGPYFEKKYPMLYKKLSIIHI